MWAKSHPLYGAQLRFERSQGHLAEADRLIRDFSKACENNIISDDNGKSVRLNGWPDIPIMLPVVISDAIHNLRAALDYVVYELALFDSGQIQNGTQFPIEDIKSDHPVRPKRGFDARRYTYLKGVNDVHVNTIENMQPYKGVDWTKSLALISNPDKHRKLTTLDSKDRRFQGVFEFDRAGKFLWPDAHPNHPTGGRYNVTVDAYDAITIAPSDASKPSIMSTLRHIEAAVSSTIELFKSGF